MLPESFISQLKYACDIEQIVSSYTKLTRKGKNMVGNCPFHSEKTPSFFIYPQNQSYYCFGCGAGGDVITFVMAAENLDYIEAVKMLAQRAGLNLPEDDTDYKETKMKARILEINKETARFYHQTLISDDGKAAYRYLTDRGLTPRTIRRFGLGKAPDGWNGVIDHLMQKGFYMNELEAAGVAVKSREPGKSGKHYYYDRFRGRIIFPIIDIRGNVIAFGGRATDGGGAKYVNSSDTPVFKKSRNLFALNIAKQTKKEFLILCEGYMDVISVHQGGFDNAVATLGTAITDEQARLIAKYTQKVVLAYDSDKAGQAATKKAMQIFEKTGIAVNVLSLGDAKDPDEYIKKYGSERFDILLSGSANSVEYRISRINEKFDVATDDGKVGFLKEFAVLMSELQSPIEREVYISGVANRLEVGKQAIELQVERILKAAKKKETKKQSSDTTMYIGGVHRERPKVGGNMKTILAEERTIAALCNNPDYIRLVEGRLTEEDFHSYKEIYTVLAGRIQSSMSLDIIHLSGELSRENVSALAGMIAAAQMANPSPKEMEDYINILIEARTVKTESQVAQMSDDQLKDYFDKLAAKKK